MQTKKWGNFSVRETGWMVRKHQFCHKTLPEIYYNKDLAPLQVLLWRQEIGLGLAFGRFRQSHCLFALVQPEQKLANSFILMATYRTVTPQLQSSDARKPLISNTGLPWASSYPFVLPELSLNLNEPSFLAFVFLIIFIETNHKNIKDAHIDSERKKKKQHVWKTGGWGGLKMWNFSLYLNFKHTAFASERGMGECLVWLTR